MTVKELVQRATEARLPCSPDVIAKYSEAGLLPVPTGGGRGRGKAAQYPEETLPKLLLLLKLRQEYPAGFGVYSNENLFEFVGRGEEADLYLPALLYIMEIPNADADTARQAALNVLDAAFVGFSQDLTKHEHRTDILPALLYIGSGDKHYQQPEIYSVPDHPANEASPTLLDEYKAIMPARDFWGDSLDLLNGMDLATLTRINDRKSKTKAVQDASEETLLLAAFGARFAFYHSQGRYRAPYANALVHWWLFALSVMRLYPQTVEFVRMARIFLPLVLSAASELEIPSRGATIHDVFNSAVKVAERTLAGNALPTDKTVG